MNTMYRSLLAKLFFTFVAFAIMTLFWLARAPALIPAAVVGTTLAATGFLFIWLNREKTWIEDASAVVWIATTVMVISIIFGNHEYYIESHWPFQPFIGIKIAAVFLPIICPPRRSVGWTTLAIFAFVPVWRYYFWEPAYQMALGIQEPWITFIFVAGSAIVYSFRLRLAEFQQFEIEVAVRVKSLARFARLLLGAQHLLNTPLQTIELTVARLTSRGSSDDKKLQEAFASIREVSNLLASIDGYVQWDSHIVLPKNSGDLEQDVKSILHDFDDKLRRA